MKGGVEELLFTAVLLFVVELEILLGPLLPLPLPLLVLSELDEVITAREDEPESCLPVQRMRMDGEGIHIEESHPPSLSHRDDACF